MRPEGPIRVLCVDDHSLIIEGVKAILETEPGMQFIARGGTGEEAVDLFRLHRPDVSLIDLLMPGMGGVEAIRAIRQENQTAKLIALTTYRGDADIYRALAAGASGYLLKDLMRKDLTDAIKKVHAGGKFISPEAAAKLAEHSPRLEISARELSVLRLVAEGMRNKEIAGALSITEETVKFHIKSILSKLGVSDRTHAVTTAIRRGLLRLE